MAGESPSIKDNAKVDMTLSDLQRAFWGWNLPLYFKSLRETFGPDVQQESSFKAIPTDGDDVDMFLGDIGHAAPVIEVVQKLMQLAIGKSSSTISQDTKTEQKLINPPSDPNGIYSFVPFNNSKEQIRMIELVPAQPEDLITLRLFVANDASQYSYEALSYVWGSRDSDVSIQVNGNELNVSGNLAEALRCLRPNQGENGRILWVDAVCINQADNAEKSDQVALMGDIYRKAKEVLIFLGEERDDSALVMQYLKQEDTEQSELSTPPADVDGRRKEDKGLKREKDVVARIKRFQLDQVQLIRAADAFFKRPWWARTWVVQEYVLAIRPPRWYCGREWVSTANVRERLFELHVCLSDRTQPLLGDHELLMDANIDIGKQYGYIMPHRRYNIRQLLVHERENYRSLLPFNLLILLMYRESTDPRDRLYALCEMLDPVSKEIFLPDYNARVEHVFMKLSSYLLVSGGMRQKVFSRFELLQAPSVPSWVLDFSKPLSLIATGFLDRYMNEAPWTKGASCPVVHNRVLGIPGNEIDSVERVYPLGDVEDDMQSWASFWRLQGLLHHHHASEPLPERARACVPEKYLFPFPELIEDWKGTPLEALKLLFPAPLDLPGFQQFLTITMQIPLTAAFDPQKLTCDKWKDGLRPIGYPAELVELIQSLQSTGAENFIGGCLFDRTNMEAQLSAVQRVDPAAPKLTKAPDETSIQADYRPSYAHIKDVMSKAANEAQLRAFKQVIVLLADMCIKIADDSINGRAPGGEQLTQELKNLFTFQCQDTISAFERISENCSCSEEDKPRHRDSIERVVKGIEQGMIDLKVPIEQVMSLLNLYDMGSVESSREASWDIAKKNFKSAFTTRRGFVGYTCQPDSGIRAGDKVAVLHGMAAPVVVQQVEGEGKYRMKGFADVIGIRDVDLSKLEELGIFVRRDFRLV